MLIRFRRLPAIAAIAALAACASLDRGLDAARDGAAAGVIAARKAAGIGPPEALAITRAANVALTPNAPADRLAVEIEGFGCADAQLRMTIIDARGRTLFAHEIAYADYMRYGPDQAAACEDDLEAFAFRYFERVIKTDTRALAPYALGGGPFTPTARRETFERARRSETPILCLPTTRLGGPCLWCDPATGAAVEIAQFAIR